MILQALKAYYDRVVAEPDCDIPRFGYSREKIHWAIVIDRDGNLVPPILDIRRTIIDEKKKKEHKIPREMNVFTTTATASRSGTDPSSNLFWDNSAFVLGAKKKSGDSEKYFHKFKKMHHKFGDNLFDEGMQAILKFLDQWQFQEVDRIENWNEIAGGNLVFRLDGDLNFIHQRKKIREAWEQYILCEEEDIAKESNKNFTGICLITGDTGIIARIHRQIKGIKEPNGLRDAQTTGGSLIGFQDAKTAFCSYGMDHRQSFNSPISIHAAFAYTTALNWMLRADSGQKIQIADATTVFWAERPSLMEQSFHHIFNPPREEEGTETVDDQETAHRLQVYLDAVRQGKRHEFEAEKNVKFFVLGLSPNTARISVRFWHVSTVADIAEKIGGYFQEISLNEDETHYPSLFRLLVETAILNKKENISPLLGGAMMRAILTGERYPESLLPSVITRIRAIKEDKDKKVYKVTRNRIMLIKACLIRNFHREVTEMLDRTNKEPAYLLGRMFAVMEGAQMDALERGVSSTIKDRYFSSASAAPRSVFPILLRMNQHHVSKGEHGGRYTRLIADIMEDLPAKKFPAHLSLENQGLFAVGYYHQRNDLFKGHNNREEETTEG